MPQRLLPVISSPIAGQHSLLGLCTDRDDLRSYPRLKQVIRGYMAISPVHGRRLDKRHSCSGMVAASLACTQMRGCFVEVGKRDIWSPQRAVQERPDLAYRLVAIDFWTPGVVGRNMMRLAAMLGKGGPSIAGDASLSRRCCAGPVHQLRSALRCPAAKESLRACRILQFTVLSGGHPPQTLMSQKHLQGWMLTV